MVEKGTDGLRGEVQQRVISGRMNQKEAQITNVVI